MKMSNKGGKRDYDFEQIRRKFESLDKIEPGAGDLEKAHTDSIKQINNDGASRPKINHHHIVKFFVRSNCSGGINVFEDGFEQPIAEFDDLLTAETYALQLAETKRGWKVDVYNASGTLVGTYNSEDDSMPRPNIS
jgi:hypothetical protein